jgi:hypothetical protein
VTAYAVKKFRAVLGRMHIDACFCTSARSDITVHYRHLYIYYIYYIYCGA